MLKISCAGCLGLSPAILAQFSLEMCVTAQNRETPYFEGSWSFKVIDVDIPKKPVASACYDACLCLSATIYMLDNLINVK